LYSFSLSLHDALPIYFDLVAAREEFHLRHSRFDPNSFWRHFHGIDLIIKLDADYRFLERMIKGGDPFDLERLGCPCREHLQIRQDRKSTRLNSSHVSI